MSSLSTNKAMRVTARLLQFIVAAVFLTAAGLKAFDPLAFAEQIRAYGILPALADVAAWSFIITEMLLAAALVTNFLPRLTGALTLALLALFVGVTIFAMSQGQTSGCGCFGNALHRAPETVILEDALMMAAIIFGLLVYGKRKPTGTLWKSLLILGVGGIAAATTAFAYRLPVDDLVTDLRVGAEFSSWPVEGLNRNLQSGPHVVFLFSSESPTVEAEVSMMNTIAQTEGIPSAVGLLTEGTAAVTEVMFQYGTAFPIAALEPRFARTLYRTLPRTFILHDGRVEAVWSAIPSPADVRREMARILSRSDDNRSSAE